MSASSRSVGMGSGFQCMDTARGRPPQTPSSRLPASIPNDIYNRSSVLSSSSPVHTGPREQIHQTYRPWQGPSYSPRITPILVANALAGPFVAPREVASPERSRPSFTSSPVSTVTAIPVADPIRSPAVAENVPLRTSRENFREPIHDRIDIARTRNATPLATPAFVRPVVTPPPVLPTPSFTPPSVSTVTAIPVADPIRPPAVAENVPLRTSRENFREPIHRRIDIVRTRNATPLAAPAFVRPIVTPPPVLSTPSVSYRQPVSTVTAIPVARRVSPPVVITPAPLLKPSRVSFREPIHDRIHTVRSRSFPAFVIAPFTGFLFTAALVGSICAFAFGAFALAAIIAGVAAAAGIITAAVIIHAVRR